MLPQGKVELSRVECSRRHTTRLALTIEIGFCDTVLFSGDYLSDASIYQKR